MMHMALTSFYRSVAEKNPQNNKQESTPVVHRIWYGVIR